MHSKEYKRYYYHWTKIIGTPITAVGFLFFLTFPWKPFLCFPQNDRGCGQQLLSPDIYYPCCYNSWRHHYYMRELKDHKVERSAILSLFYLPATWLILDFDWRISSASFWAVGKTLVWWAEMRYWANFWSCSRSIWRSVSDIGSRNCTSLALKDIKAKYKEKVKKKKVIRHIKN